MKDWRKSVLRTLGYKPTAQNLQFLSTWQRWEGGHTNNTARFNWLNTTHGDGEKINSVGVRRFKTYDEGIMNTTETLLNGRYQDILDALRSGDPYKFGPSAGLQTWVSGKSDGNPGYAQKILGGKGGAAPTAVSSPPRSAAPPPPQGLALSKADADWNFTMDFLNRNRHDRRFLDSLKRAPSLADLQPTAPDVPAEPKVGKVGKLAPKTADWGGSKSIAQQMLSAMKASGAVVSSEKRSTKNTASGGISDHWEGSTTSYAFDVSGTEERMAKASRMLHEYLGLKHTPGQWTEIIRNGYRIQIGWKVAGHYDHVHFGVRKV
jgi:hypothetical protein